MVDLRPTIIDKVNKGVVQSTREEVLQANRQVEMSNHILSAVQRIIAGHVHDVDLSSIIAEGMNRQGRPSALASFLNRLW